MKMLLRVVNKTIGGSSNNVQVRHANEINEKRYDPSLDEPKLFCMEGCLLEKAFTDAHRLDVKRLYDMFMSLRRFDVRIELVQWQLQRVASSHGFCDMNLNMFVSPDYHELVDLTNDEYGKMTYPRRQDMCDHCGVIHYTRRHD